MTVSHSSGPNRAASDLRKLLIFRDLSDSHILSIAKRLKYKSYVKGQEIIGQYEYDDGVYFVLAGIVRITVYSAAGKEIRYRELEQGSMFGELSAIDGQARSANAVALTDALVGRASATEFWALLKEFPEMNDATLKYLCGLVRDLSTRYYQLSAFAVCNRIRMEILRFASLADPDGNSVTISPAPNQADIATLANTQREAVTKEISRLVRAGLIQRGPGSLIVKDVDALRELTEEVPK